MGFRGRRRAREAALDEADVPFPAPFTPEPTEPDKRARLLLEECLTEDQVRAYDRASVPGARPPYVIIRGGRTGSHYRVHPEGAVFGYCVSPVLRDRAHHYEGGRYYGASPLLCKEDRFVALKLWIEGNEAEFLTQAVET